MTLPYITKLIGPLAGLLGIGFLIGFHELGHFLFAKLFSVDTPEFSIGFGPRIFRKKFGKTNFSLSAIPVGGYVQMAHSADNTTPFANTFDGKPLYQKLLILLGGILFNLLFAYIAMIAVFSTGSSSSKLLYPVNATAKIESVCEGSATQQAGLIAGDTIISYDDILWSSGVDFFNHLKEHKDQSISLQVTDHGKEKNVIVPSLVSQQGLDFELERKAYEDLSIGEAIKKGIRITNRFIINMTIGLKHIFSKCDVSKLGGPIKIIAQAGEETKQGVKSFLILLAILSVNLALLNLLPLPILDGGQILFYGIEALIGRSIPSYIREWIFIATWVAFLFLILYLTYADIKSLIQSYMGQ